MIEWGGGREREIVFFFFYVNTFMELKQQFVVTGNHEINTVNTQRHLVKI